MLCDAQTSGGLLVVCDPAAAADVRACFRTQSFAAAAAVGEVRAGPAAVQVR